MFAVYEEKTSSFLKQEMPKLMCVITGQTSRMAQIVMLDSQPTTPNVQVRAP